jgi:hypothetical protein
MIKVTFESADAYLLDDAPDWTTDPELTAVIPANLETGLTRRETRTPLGDTLRLSLNYTAILEGDALINFRNSLQNHNTQPVLCPLWVAGFEPGDTPIVTADYYVLIDDTAAPAIHVAADAPFLRTAYPLMVGRLANIPDPSLLTDEHAAVSIQFTENDDSSLTVTAYSFTAAGLAVPSGAYLFPVRPNWGTSPNSGKAEVDMDRRDIGDGRIKADAYYDQPSYRSCSQAFTLSDTEPWQLLYFFLLMKGDAKPFWLPAGISDARLAADCAALATSLTITGISTLLSDRSTNNTFLLDDLANRKAVKATGLAAGTLTLSGAVGQAYDVGITRIESLILARFKEGSLKLKFQDPLTASASISFCETPWEVAAVTGETAGTTMGTLPTNAYLYVFAIAYPGANQTYKYTSFERDLAGGYVRQWFEHDDINETATLERQEVQIRSRMFSGNPMALLLPFALEWPLQIRIYECDVTGSTPTNLRAVFVGECEQPEADGPFITVTAKSLGAILERKCPRFLLQPGCNLSVFEPLCGLNRDDWKWQATATAFDATNLILTVNAISRVTGAAVTLDAHYFAGGYMFFGSGASVQYRAIADSTVISGGSITITLASPFVTNPGAGAIIYMHPGCGGRFSDDCTTKFGNQANFVGAPFMPVGNPSAIKVSKNVTQGGKK